MPDRHLRVETRELNWAPGHGFASTPRAAEWAGGSRPPSSGRSAERGRAGGADALRSSRGAASLPAAGRAHAADGWPSRETFSLRFHYENVLHMAADEKAAKQTWKHTREGEEERADVFAADCRFSDAERTGHSVSQGVLISNVPVPSGSGTCCFRAARLGTFVLSPRGWADSSANAPVDGRALVARGRVRSCFNPVI